MSSGIWAALSGANVQLEALDVAANNVANATTPAFRGDHAVFREYLGRATSAAQKNNAPKIGRMPPTSMRYSTVDGVAANALPGGFVSTGRSLDVAIHGDGLLTISTPRGVRYTRLGSIQVEQDGRLVTKDGDTFLNRENNKPIRVPAGVTDVRISADGTVTAANETIGQLNVVNFKNALGLAREGSLVYRATPASGPPLLSTSTLQSEQLEQSNVPVVEETVDIDGAPRGFEACERAIDAFRDADRRAAMSIMGKD